MKIHFISNSLKLNSGFSNVAYHLAKGFQELGHDITFSGMQTGHVKEWTYGIEVLPIETYYIDGLTRYVLNLQKIKPDIAIAIYQTDSGENLPYSTAFKSTILYSVVEGDNLPYNSINGFKQIIANGGIVVLPSKHGVKQCAKEGIPVFQIPYGYDANVYKPLNLKVKNIRDKSKYCFYCTDFGKLITNPEKLCKQGCYDCKTNNANDHAQDQCKYFEEEWVTLLRFERDNNTNTNFNTNTNTKANSNKPNNKNITNNNINNKSGRWVEKNIKISDLHTFSNNKFVFGLVKLNFGVRHRMERLLNAYSIFLNESQRNKDRTLLYIHTMPISTYGINLIDIIQKLGIEDNVIFSYGTYSSSGWSEQALNILYNIFDCYTSTSSGESWGIPTVEAMACGKPVIGPSSSAFIELVEDNDKDNKNNIGPRGILAKIAAWQRIEDGSYRSLVDENDFAQKMQIIYQNKELRDQFSKNCLEFTKSYTWEKIIKKWNDILIKI